VIRSPINGVVLSRTVEPGQTVAASLQAPVLFTLAEDLTRMELRVNVDEADVGQVADGQEASFSVDAWPDRTFSARVTQVRLGAKTLAGVVTYETVLSVDNADGLLRPGMTATADITVRSVRDVLMVPNAALRFSPPAPRKEAAPSGGLLRALIAMPRFAQRPKDGRAPSRAQRLWVLRDGKPAEVPVTTGASDGAWTEVTSGEIAPGTALIVDATPEES
jgi:HlyD family secretion protein